MDLATFHGCLEQAGARGYPLNQTQRAAVDHGGEPLWIIAGPGTGKSEVLVTRTLKLVCVDGRVDPRSILLTTFTAKAARNLQDRLASYMLALQSADPSLKAVDLSDLRIGTLHSLCNDILQEYRYSGYQNVRLLDDIEQHLFVYRQADIAASQDTGFWAQFAYAVSGWQPGGSYAPNKWQRARAAVTLFNHIVEDLVDVGKMRQQGGHWETLAAFYEQYEQALTARHRCDFAHLQKRFLDFISAPAGAAFLSGDGRRPALSHVLVDEYQDTNPIQERIYLRLAGGAPHSITVVGDDDQALYRFRGGNVSCMVNFDRACQTTFGVEPAKVQLDENYRSHPSIVDFFNLYISSFPEMNVAGVRAPGKHSITASSSVQGAYPAVSWISPKQANGLAGAAAALVADHLLADGVISDPSQCVLLLRSTKDSPHNAGPYIKAFQDAGIPVYNPRSKSFMESEEVQCLLATLIQVVDDTRSFQQSWTRGLKESVQSWVDTLDTIRHDPAVPTKDLDTYISRSQAGLRNQCASVADGFVNLSMLEILYRITAFEPFRTWRTDLVRNQRLAKVTRLFESYHSFDLDNIRAEHGAVSQSFLNSFYNTFISYLIEAGINDDEDDEVIVPPGYISIMTIHQAKGLEFPFVIVGHLGNKGYVGAAQHLEHDLAPFRDDLYARNARPVDMLALEDDIRLLYVAYSRAQYGLILAGTFDQIKKHVAAPGRDGTTFRRTTHVI